MSARNRGATPVRARHAAAEAALPRCTLTVTGMDCSSCADTVNRALRKLEGVWDVQIDIVRERVTVSHAESLDPRAFASVIERVGYHVAGSPSAERDGAAAADAVATTRAESRRLRDLARGLGRHTRLILATLSGVLWALSIGATRLMTFEALSPALAIGAMIAGGWFIVPRGVRAARTGALDMNLLMSIAAFGALIIGEYLEAATALFLFSVAQLLESHSMDRARNAIRALMDLSPAEATVLRGGRELRVPVDDVAVAEVVVVRPGEKITVDGDVIAGSSSVDQAPITGESIPVEKHPGDEVFAGTLNGEGAIEVRATRRASDTTLARIIHAVEEAQSTRAPSQQFVDRFARVYTPAVIATAAAVFLLPPLLGLGAWGDWFYRSLVLLVVACPCALVISTPVTVVSALAGAARRGILIKGGLHLENAGRATVLALDKTGTLTEGQAEVVDVIVLNGATPHEVLSLAAGVESRSEHPLGRAIHRHALAKGVKPAHANGISAAVGRGVVGSVAGETVYVGSERLFRELGAVDAEATALVRHHAEAGRTAVLVGATRAGSELPVLHGVIAIADRIRDQAVTALRKLHDAGIERVVMLTGDNRAAAEAVARQLTGRGVDEIRAGLLPEDKVAAIRELRARGSKVLMVGDGINDAPALAAADVGVAMGSAGTDVALETADIALMADDLDKLTDLVRFARKAERIIRANIAFSLLTKAAFVLLAIAGAATLWMAVLADTGASLLVIMNGLRALRA